MWHKNACKKLMALKGFVVIELTIYIAVISGKNAIYLNTQLKMNFEKKSFDYVHQMKMTRIKT